MSLVARHLEANGIPTLCLGSALDIFGAGQPPRAVFIDYPLGHSTGKPFDESDQADIVRAALRGFETLRQPGEIITLPNAWNSDDAWRESASSTQGEDTRQARDEAPQFQFPADRVAAIASGAVTN
ncbi:MAG: hypothetical protein EXR86_16545 [Gammaproteobacteria bacterium]|nr:hypothetical protein [Gammaproteobacteria bacterium]